MYTASVNKCCGVGADCDMLKECLAALVIQIGPIENKFKTLVLKQVEEEERGENNNINNTTLARLQVDHNNILQRLGMRSFRPKAPAGFLFEISIFY